MAGVKGDPTNELDGMVRDDMVLGEEIAKLMRARDMRIRFIAGQIREESEPFDRQPLPLQEKRHRLRQAIHAIWSEHHDGQTALELLCARVSRRNYRELLIRDKEAILDALDRADRPDLVGYVFDEKVVFGAPSERDARFRLEIV